MFDKLFDFLNNLISPITKLIDDANTSEEEKAEIKKAVYELQVKSQMKLAELQLESMKIQAELQKSVNKDGNWLQKSVRPIMLLSFVSIAVLNAFGVIQSIPEWMGDTINVSMGILVGGRSLEKIAYRANGIFERGKK